MTAFLGICILVGCLILGSEIRHGLDHIAASIRYEK